MDLRHEGLKLDRQLRNCQRHIENPAKYLGWSFIVKIANGFKPLIIFFFKNSIFDASLAPLYALDCPTFPKAISRKSYSNFFLLQTQKNFIKKLYY